MKRRRTRSEKPKAVMSDSDPSLTEIMSFLRAHWDDGLNCPACGQFVKLYRRSTTSSMVLALMLLYHHYMQVDNDFVHVPSFVASHKHFPNRLLGALHGGDYAKLRHLGLIEGKEEKREDDSDRNGYWRITDLGCRFIRGEAKVPKKFYIFDDRLYGVSDELIDVEKCLKKKFNYRELMDMRV